MISHAMFPPASRLEKAVLRWVTVIFLVLAAFSAHAGELRDLRLWASPEGTRVVFELASAPDHHVFTLDAPSRIVVDLPATAGASIANKVKGQGVVQKIRAAAREDGSLRVVLDMASEVNPRTFLLDPADQYGYRLVLDIGEEAPGVVIDDAIERVARKVTPPLKEEAWKPRPVIVAIDAGHGGEDPGAIGKHGAREKDVALALSRRLAEMINAEPGFKAVMTRDGDYYLGLRERINRARKAQADLFVSVHANAITNRSKRGSSVYVVSPRGATSEHAHWLAQKENAADLVGGIALDNKGDDLASVLIDLSQSSTMEASFDVGARVLKALGQVNPLLRNSVQQAAFVVLKAPDIPSVLVETAFISNPTEERILVSKSGQEKLARSIFLGVKGYFESYRPRELQPDPGSPRLLKVQNDQSTFKEDG